MSLESYDNLFPNDEHKGMDDKQVEEHYNLTKLKTINYLHLGLGYKIKTWYYSPYPSEYQNLDTLFVCENCMFISKEKQMLENHIKT